jgi:NAD(P)-dependent dehydrogenase (short-subunit alcohol dehydrogenase family)
VEYRNATAAVIGAGDYIGTAIAKKFAAEGFTIFAGRRNGDKLAPLLADVEAQGGRIVARSLDARKEADITAFLHEADQRAPLEVCIFNIGANVNSPLLEATERVFHKVWAMARYAGFLAGPEVNGPCASTECAPAAPRPPPGKGQTIPNRSRSARPGIECTPGEDPSMSDTIIPGMIFQK